MKRFVRWFEINWGWFFVNGQKRDAWARYVRKKYGYENEIQDQKEE
jgi:hypothetical protein